MSEELGIKKKPRVDLDLKRDVNLVQDYKHHKKGRFTCEAEVEQDGKTICCMHDPITGDWEWPEKKADS